MELDGRASRRLRTRQALLDAARGLMAEGRSQASIEEITRRAGVGFGSFRNHFSQGKQQLFAEALMQVLDEYAERIRSAVKEVDDPAEVFARSFCLTMSLGVAQPALLDPVVARGTDPLVTGNALRSLALAHLERGTAAGRFAEQPAEVHLMMVGGVLLGVMRLLKEDPSALSPGVMADVTTGVLRMLGLDEQEASAVAARAATAVAPST